MHERRREALVHLAAWAGFALAASVLAAAMAKSAEYLLFAAAGDRIKLVLVAAAASAGLGLLLAGAASILATVAFWLLVERIYRSSAPAVDTPASADPPPPVPASGHLLPRLGPWGIAGTGVVALAGTTALTLRSIGERIDLDHEVEVTAHRGSSLTAPENTLSALEQAIADRADFAEVDLQTTSDGHVVLCHDKDLRRIAGIPRNVADLTLHELRKIDAGSWFDPRFAGQRIPTLEEAIECARDRIRLNLELKFSGRDDPLAERVAGILAQTAFTPNVVFSSLSQPGLRGAMSVLPEVPAGLIVTAAVGDVTRLDVGFLSVNAKSVDRDLIDRARRAGLGIHVWTVNEPADMLAMIHIGVDNIITDEPAVLADLLAERRALSPAEKTVLWLADFLDGRL